MLQIILRRIQSQSQMLSPNTQSYPEWCSGSALENPMQRESFGTYPETQSAKRASGSSATPNASLQCCHHIEVPCVKPISFYNQVENKHIHFSN